MKLVIISVHFEYADTIAELVDRHEAAHYFLYPRIHGHDSEGFHDGSQVFPGNMSALHVRVDDAAVAGLLEDLERFRVSRKAHHHLEAMVLNIEAWIGPSARP